tara:strand:- start:1067 stop:1321 length:255 start_codon:yes stop_codon:yes gene_type:complete
MARCVQISDYFSVEPQARFLNFTIYYFTWKSSNLKIWRLFKIAQTIVLARTCAIFHRIHCCQQLFCAFHSGFKYYSHFFESSNQ